MPASAWRTHHGVLRWLLRGRGGAVCCPSQPQDPIIDPTTISSASPLVGTPFLMTRARESAGLICVFSITRTGYRLRRFYFAER